MPRGTRSPDSYRLRKRNTRAVLPKPFQRVVDTLLGMLDMDHYVQIVQKYPAILPLPLPAYRPDTCLAHLFFDVINDRPDLAIVRSRTEEEHVGDDELLADVVSNDVRSELLSRGLGRDPRKLDGPGGSCHV